MCAVVIFHCTYMIECSGRAKEVEQFPLRPGSSGKGRFQIRVPM